MRERFISPMQFFAHEKLDYWVRGADEDANFERIQQFEEVSLRLAQDKSVIKMKIDQILWDGINDAILTKLMILSASLDELMIE